MHFGLNTSNSAFLICISIILTLSIGSAAAKPELSFGVMADVQYCDHNSIGSTCYRTATGKLEQAVKNLNLAEPNFVIQLGDFVDRDFNSYDVIMPIYDKLKMPHYHVLGNHDWGTKSGNDKVLVPRRFGLSTPNYDFNCGKWRFIVLNSSDISVSSNPEGSERYIEAQKLCEKFKKEGKPNGFAWCASISKEQLNWLKSVLKQARDANERVIVFAHHTLLPWTDSRLWNADEVIDILEKSGCVAAYICGHDHREGYVFQNGIHYITINAMVETPDKNAYAIFSVFEDHIDLKGYGRVTSRTLEIPANINRSANASNK